jgi:hypothetical protein
MVNQIMGRLRILAITFISWMSILQMHSQGLSLDSNLVKSMSETKGSVDVLKKIKFTGLIQFQYQHADTVGIKSCSGGDFSTYSADRFTVRRGRLKAEYTGNLTQYVMQLQFNESDVSLRDVYASITDPWTKSITWTSGIFIRPFGFDLDYSDLNREGPERSRMVQVLFPGERDLGSMIQIAPAKGPCKFVNLRFGVFTGNAIAKETDHYKDFIGRLGFHFPITHSNFTIDGGLSSYFGKQRKDETYLKDGPVVLRDTSGKVSTFQISKKIGASSFIFNEETESYIKRDSGLASGVVRTYLGADLQLNYIFPVIGKLSIRGEYITGKLPGTSTPIKVYQAGSGDLFLRRFSGYYVWVTQNLGKKNQVYMKYDVFDPNSEIDGNKIGNTGSYTSAADLKYSTFGFGYSFIYDINVKLSAYYEFVANESAPGLKGDFNRDLPDNVLTIRLQYKF